MINFSSLISNRVFSYYKVAEHSNLNVEIVSDPRTLLVPQRFDLPIKLYYIDAYVRKLRMEFPTEVYCAHIHSITAFTNKEKGQKEKSSQNAFVDTFNKLIDSFLTEGYDSSRSIIPISREGIILDGAHRLACAIYFNIPLKVLRLNYVGVEGEIKVPIYNFKYFQKYALSDEYLDIAARQYLKYTNKNVYLACLWPSIIDSEKRKLAIKLLSEEYPVIYIKKTNLSYVAFDRLVSQIYMNDYWVGSVENNFKGSSGKSLLCYNKRGYECYVLFEGKSKEDTLQLKDRIRDIFKIGKHSIHISDNTDDSIFISNYVFNTTTLNVLEKAQLGKYSHSLKKIIEINDTEVVDIHGAKILFSLEAPGDEKCYSLRNEDLKGFSIEDIKNNPRLSFFYAGKQFLYPTQKIANEVLKADPGGKYFDAEMSNGHISQKTLYYYRYFQVKIEHIVYPCYKAIRKIIKR